MIESTQHGIASPEDFRRAAAVRESEAERVILPKLGKAVLLRRPSPMWFVFRGRLPQSLATKVAGQPPNLKGGGTTPAQDLAELAEWIVALLQQTLVEPRVSLNPGPGEIAPELLDIEDVNFIIRWAYGELGTEGEGSAASLDSFRPERQPAAAGASGGNVGLPSQ